jgi:hypothetical protein
VYESDAVAEPPEGRAADADVPISAAPVPAASAALWKRFVKPAPVGAFAFETVADSVVAAPAVAETGVTEPVVRSGSTCAPTATEAAIVAFGPTPLPHVSVNVVVTVSAPVLTLPLATGVAEPMPLSMEQVTVPPPVTPLQLRFVLAPLRTFPESGEKEPIATFARQRLPFHVLPATQLAVTVFVSSTAPFPFFRS